MKQLFDISIRKLFRKLFRKRLKTSLLNYPGGQFDIIGDVHGYCGELISLLTHLGYSLKNGFWQHPQRKAVFAGDFISRGPDSRGVINIVRGMTENGSGLAILGNHELNAIGYFTTDKSGSPFLQPAPSNRAQLEKIRMQYDANAKSLNKDIKWMRSLPFFLKLGPIRVVHAYWNQKHVKIINRSIRKGKLTKKLIREIAMGKSRFAMAVRQTTRGIELNLPGDLIIKDSKNVRRRNFRVKWWKSPYDKTFRQLSFGNRFKLPKYTVPDQIITPFRIYDLKQPIVFFGHYCINDEQSLIVAPNACCVDHCLAGTGQLAAYRWNGNNRLTKRSFVFQERLDKS